MVQVDGFLSVGNMKRLVVALEKHFEETLDCNLRELGVPIKQLLHRVMRSVLADYGESHDTLELNRIAVRIAKDFLLRVCEAKLSPPVPPPPPPPRPRQRAPSRPVPATLPLPLSRPVPVPVPVPASSSASASASAHGPSTSPLPSLLRSDDSLAPGEVRDDPAGEVRDDPLSGEEWRATLRAREAAREAETRDGWPSARGDVPIGDPHRDHLAAVAAAEAHGDACLAPFARVGAWPPGAGGAGGAGHRADTIVPRAGRKRLVEQYLMVNGVDRDVSMYKSRFEFRVDLARNSAVFRDVRSISARRLVIPREIVEERTVTHVPKTQFNHDFGLRYPYLILRVDEFNGVYRSPSAASSSAFAHFVYDGSHVTPFGRSYVQMKPVMDEVLKFETSAYATLATLGVSLRQPSGALVNESRDDFRLFWVSYDETNSKFLHVQLSRYFDKNVFFVGDRVRISDFRAARRPGEPTAYAHDRGAELEEFLNREDGHDIVEVINATSSGFYENFYIQPPGTFDSATGRYAVDAGLVDGAGSALGDTLATLTPPDALAAEDREVYELGRIVNLSLQISVAFKVVVEEDDVSV